MDVGTGIVAARIARESKDVMRGPVLDQPQFFVDIVDKLRREPSTAHLLAQAGDHRAVRIGGDGPVTTGADLLESRLGLVASVARSGPREILVPATEDAWMGLTLLHSAHLNSGLIDPTRATPAVVANLIAQHNAAQAANMLAVANIGTEIAVIAPFIGKILESSGADWSDMGALAAMAVGHELRHLDSGVATVGLHPNRFVSWFQEGGAQLAAQSDLVGQEARFGLRDPRASFSAISTDLYPTEKGRIDALSRAAGHDLADADELRAFADRFRTLDDVDHLDYLVARTAERQRTTPDDVVRSHGIGLT